MGKGYDAGRAEAQPDSARATERTKTAFELAYDASVRRTLDAIDGIKAYLTGEVTDLLPAVVVIGDQSSGKSSVLESLSGIALPRGEGIVTRCPLQLAMRQGEEGVWISYGETPDFKPVDGGFEGVGQAILNATDALAGARKGVVDKLISLRIQRPDAPDLTLTDLPGITRNPVGDQPEDIEDQVKNLIINHASGDAKINLVVLPATADIAAAEGLKIAKKLDPKGERTLGVVTKVDMQPSNLHKKLDGTDETVPKLQLGYVGVLNRSPDDIQQNRSAEEMRNKEIAFFEATSDLRALNADCKGCPALIRQLLILQNQRIQSFMPGFKQQLRFKEAELHAAIAKNRNVIVSELDAYTVMNRCLTALNNHFRDIAKAHYNFADKVDKQKDLRMPPRINETAKDYLSQAWEAIGGRAWPYSEECLDYLHLIMQESDGVTLPDCMVNDAVGDVFRDRIWCDLEHPAQAFIGEVHDKVAEVLSALVREEFAEHPNLAAFLQDKVAEKLDSAKQVAMTEVSKLVEQQQIITTFDPVYKEMVAGLDDILASFKQPPEPGSSDNPANPAHSGPEKARTAFLSLAGVASLPDDDEQRKTAMEAWAKLEQAMADKDTWLTRERLYRAQFQLGAYTQVVMRHLGDAVPRKARWHLVRQVQESIPDLASIFHNLGPELLKLMSNPQKAARLLRDQTQLQNIQKARRALSRV